MSTGEDNNYLSNYQYNHFKDDGESFKKIVNKRKCLAQTFISCSNLTNEEVANTILDDKLKEISNLIDEHSGINNYASSIQTLTSNLSKNECLQWQNELHLLDFKDLINSYQCCTKKEPLEEEFKQLCIIEPLKCNISIHDNIVKKDSLQNYKQLTIKQVDNIEKNNCISSNGNNQASKRNNFGFFKTAREELDIQNTKKYANNSRQNSSNNQQSITKKSLGSRRGVQSKFIPPVRNDDECYSYSTTKSNNKEAEWNNEEEQDERLKNIEPKMVELIRSEIMDNNTTITWDDIAGLEFAKTIIKEVVVWPLLRPDIFTGLRRPPKGILLFGPPGTGKTLIGKCIASQSQSTFFSISASSLTSKWIGDGEKMVRALFAVARCHQPAVIFIDEIDSLLSQRSETEHESSRRIKTEFLVQLDGATTGDDDRILVIGATNRPQELDEAARRRFVKRLYIPLPEKTARLQIVQRLMTNERHDLTPEDMTAISELSEGYSGADMKNLCAEASLGPIRSIDINMIVNIQADQVRSITMDDFRAALNRVRASVSSNDLDQYIIWDKTYGAGGW